MPTPRGASSYTDRRVEPTVAGIAHAQTAPACAADKLALQKTEPFSSRPGENPTVGPVRRQPLAVGQELIPGDVAWMVVGNDHPPLRLGREARLGLDVAALSDPL